MSFLRQPDDASPRFASYDDYPKTEPLALHSAAT